MKEYQLHVWAEGKWNCINRVHDNLKKANKLFEYYRKTYGAINVKMTERNIIVASQQQTMKGGIN